MVLPPNLAAGALSRAQQMARSGDLGSASRICLDLLACEPNNFPALLMLGGIECDRKNFAEAARFLQRAVRINPGSPEALGSYGNVLIEIGRRDEGVQALSESIRLQPQNPATYVYRGYAHAQAGEHRKALHDFDMAVRLAPNWEFALHNRATALVALYRHKEALPDVELLLRRHPGNPVFLANYGIILNREGRPKDAFVVIERALQQQPDDIGLQSTRADILAALSRYEDALSQFEKLLALQPANPQFEMGCAHMLMEQGKLEAALQRVEKLITSKPEYGPALVLRANLLLHLERHQESFAAYDTAVARAPDYPEASYHRGSMFLLHGRFIEGWEDFERRWEVADCGFSRPELRAPVWHGEALNGRTIIVYSEQGLGDTIQFVRFLPQLRDMGARLTFLCHPTLMRLFRNLADQGIKFVASCDANAPFDFQCALMSLPQRFGTTLATLPGKVPYILPEPELVERWRQGISAGGFKIGICWQGNPAGAIDKGRSVPLAAFRPLAAFPGVRLVSLQRKHGLEQVAEVPEGMRVETVGPFDDGKDAFVDSAAIIQNLDLVVTSDTSVAHLAGALGRPVWLATKHIPDWRWMLGRSDSPWYPTMRLFRQPVAGDWTSVFAEMAHALERRRSIRAAEP